MIGMPDLSATLIGTLLAESGVGLALVAIFAIHVMRTWRDDTTTAKTMGHLQNALDLAGERERAMSERMDAVMAKLVEADHARDVHRMHVEARLDATTEQLSDTQTKLDQALAELAEAKRTRDEIARKAHQEKEEFESTIAELRAEIAQLRQLLSRRKDLGPPEGQAERRRT